MRLCRKGNFMLIKIMMVTLFMIITIGVGIYCKRSATDTAGFVLGGRSVGPWLSAFAYGTSYFSAVIFIGYAGQFGWKFGLSSTWIGIGNVIIGSWLAWVVLGRRTRVMSQHLNASTMPEFFEKRFDSKSLKLVSAIIIFVFLIPYTASVYNGLSRLFEMAFGIEEYTYCIIGMAVFTAFYVIIGGYMATAVNDFIQGIIMLVGIVITIIAVLNLNGGFTQSVEMLSSIPNAEGATNGIYTSIFGPNPSDLFSVVILTSLGTWGLPQMVQKFYAIKSEKDVRIGTIVSTVFALIVAAGSYFLGGFGRLFGDSIEYTVGGTPVYDSIIPTMLSRLPDILIGVVAMLVLSASMSTLSSLVLTSSSVITLDLIEGTVVKKMNDKKKILVMRLFLVFFIVVSALLALVQYKSSITFIAQLMGISWGALAGAFLGPFLYGLYWKGVTKLSVWCSFICGVGITTGNMISGLLGKPIIESPIVAGAIAMAVSLVIVPLVSIISQKPSKEQIKKVFNCYNKTVVTKSKNSLGE